MEDSNSSSLRDLLEQRGWYKRWYTQVMADILQPHVARMAQPEKNALLSNFKAEEQNMIALYMVKEFLRTVGLNSTGKIFEEEAGMRGGDQEFQAMVQEQFSLLTPSTTQEVQPPLLSQALHIWKVEATERQPTEQEPSNDRAGSRAQSMHNRLLRRDFSGDRSPNGHHDANTHTGATGGHAPDHSQGATQQANNNREICRRITSLNCKRCN